VVDPAQPISQVAPTDVYFVPSKAKNKENGKKFLAFLARADVQELSSSISGLLTPNKKAKLDASNEFAQKGMELLASAKGLSQFYDRDAEPEVAKVGMDGLVEYMGNPDRLDAILKKIEATRLRVHKH
jgi:multiple sugar transport system substrate-binding protein